MNFTLMMDFNYFKGGLNHVDFRYLKCSKSTYVESMKFNDNFP